MPSAAITRAVPASFSRALTASLPAQPIDVELARSQHERYCAALVTLGLELLMLEADDALPDSCFVEDTVVVAAGLALVTRPGAPSRRGETRAVADALASRLEVVHMSSPATLDGGDCMRVGTTIYVGRSARTNAAGIAQLTEAFGPRGHRVTPVDLPRDVLHLKSVCSPVGDDRIVLADSMDRRPFDGVRVITIPARESYAANTLAIGEHVLVADGFPCTAELLAKAGLDVVPLSTTEFRKADGALTCLSVLL